MKTLGDKLRKARIESGLSVEDISKELMQRGIKASPKTIYSWENSNSQPTPDALLFMCSKYGIENPLVFFEYKQNPPESVGTDSGGSIEERLFRLFANANHITDTGDISDIDKEFMMSLISIARAYLKQRRNKGE